MSKAGLPDCDGKHNRDDTSRRGQEALTDTEKGGEDVILQSKGHCMQHCNQGPISTPSSVSRWETLLTMFSYESTTS